MSETGLATFDKTIQETNLWLKAMMGSMETEDKALALTMLRATLHALRDRIGPENAVHLGAQLPMLVRGLYYEGWHMAGTPTKERHLDQFLGVIRQAFPPNTTVDLERGVRAVFDTMWEKVDPGEIEKIIRLLPEELRELWPRVAYEA